MMALTVLQSPLTVVLQEGVKIVLQEVSPYYLIMGSGTPCTYPLGD